jgi:enoyl-CoA hydratase/carnithine racemase
VSFVLVEIAAGVAELTLNRPEKRNALHWPMVRELRAAVARLAVDDAVRVVLVRGAGDLAFSAGADYRAMASATLEEQHAFSEDFLRAVFELAQLPQPTVGAVAGYAFGGGAELATALDVRLGAPMTKFRYPGVVLGRITGVQRLPQIVGLARAKEIVFTGRVVEAAEAERIGLLNRIVPLDTLFDEARALARSIATNQPLPLRLSKAAINDTFGATPVEAFERELAAEHACIAAPELRAAFAEAFERQLQRGG